MATPTYVIEHIGDRYVPVRQEQNDGLNRLAWFAGGALTAALGVHRGRRMGLAAGLVGTAMMARGALGFSPTLFLIGYLNRHGPDGDPTLAPSYQNDFPARAAQQPADLVDEQVMESFPASDPPARTATTQV